MIFKKRVIKHVNLRFLYLSYYNGKPIPLFRAFIRERITSLFNNQFFKEFPVPVTLKVRLAFSLLLILDFAYNLLIGPRQTTLYFGTW